MASLMHFVGMGRYAVYVWTAYAISAGALSGAVVLTVREYFRIEKQLGRMGGKDKELP